MLNDCQILTYDIRTPRGTHLKEYLNCWADFHMGKKLTASLIDCIYIYIYIYVCVCVCVCAYVYMCV